MTNQFKKFLIFLVSLGLGFGALFLSFKFLYLFDNFLFEICGFGCGFIFYPLFAIIFLVTTFFSYKTLRDGFID